MIWLKEKLKKEKKKLDEMIESSDGNLSFDFILEQSRKVDKLIVAFQKIKKRYINISVDSTKIRLAKNNVEIKITPKKIDTEKRLCLN